MHTAGSHHGAKVGVLAQGHRRPSSTLDDALGFGAHGHQKRHFLDEWGLNP